MTKLTKNQKATIVRLFLSGTSTFHLADAYGVTVEKVEEILRNVMIEQAEKAVHS